MKIVPHNLLVNSYITNKANACIHLHVHNTLWQKLCIIHEFQCSKLSLSSDPITESPLSRIEKQSQGICHTYKIVHLLFQLHPSEMPITQQHNKSTTSSYLEIMKPAKIIIKSTIKSDVVDPNLICKACWQGPIVRVPCWSGTKEEGVLILRNIGGWGVGDSLRVLSPSLCRISFAVIPLPQPPPEGKGGSNEEASQVRNWERRALQMQGHGGGRRRKTSSDGRRHRMRPLQPPRQSAAGDDIKKKSKEESHHGACGGIIDG